MKKIVLLIMFGGSAFITFARVHKFSPEFQAVYDAATASEVQEAQRKGAKTKIVYRVVDDDGMAGHIPGTTRSIARGRGP